MLKISFVKTIELSFFKVGIYVKITYKIFPKRKYTPSTPNEDATQCCGVGTILGNLESSLGDCSHEP
jgi:hypothetical protein